MKPLLTCSLMKLENNFTSNSLKNFDLLLANILFLWF